MAKFACNQSYKIYYETSNKKYKEEYKEKAWLFSEFALVTNNIKTEYQDMIQKNQKENVLIGFMYYINCLKNPV